MIATLRGVVVDKTESAVVLEVGGVGYGVSMPRSEMEQATRGGESHLFIQEVIREDAHDLYGFSSESGRDLFQQLLSVSGIGPKAALAILSIATVDDARRAIATGDTGFLESATGVGKRSAERVVVELRDKIAVFGASETVEGGAVPTEDAALEGLEALGYPRAEAVTALAKVSRELSDSDRIKQALKEL